MSAVVVLGSCLWRPPVIPPLASPDSGTTNNRDASTGFTDSAVMPSQDSSALTDEEACDAAARANDGSAPASVFNGGRVVSCGGSVAPDASASDAAAGDAQTDGGTEAGAIDASSADAAQDAGASDGATGDSSADAAVVEPDADTAG